MEKVDKRKLNTKVRGETNGMWKHDVDEELICKLYNDNMSVTAIANQLGLDRGTIQRRLKKHGFTIERKPRSDKSKDNYPARHKVYYKYKRQAQKRNIPFELSEEQLLNITDCKCHYCGIGKSNKEITNSGHVYEFNGIDRVDNTRGYIIDNVVPCCSICNQMKSNLPIDVFLTQIDNITKHLYRGDCNA